MLAFVRGRRYYVTVGGKRAPVIGHVGVSHTTVDVTDIECGPGTEVLLDAAPLYVPPPFPGSTWNDGALCAIFPTAP